LLAEVAIADLRDLQAGFRQPACLIGMEAFSRQLRAAYRPVSRYIRQPLGSGYPGLGKSEKEVSYILLLMGRQNDRDYR
jgi:hypothetical protein